MHNSKTVIATTSSFARESPEVLELIKNNGLTVVQNPWGRKLSEGELSKLLEEYEPVGMLAGTEPITRSILEKAKGHLRVISRVGVGWENVDRVFAEELGIQVYRTAGVLTQAVAELTIGLMLSALRAISSNDRLIRQGKWQKTMGGLLSEKVVGIIGFGNIGQRVGELVTAFGARVIYYDPQPTSVPWAQEVSLSDLLAQAEIITIHAGGSEQILGKAELKKICKPGVVLINTARGGLVDESVLQDCLMEGKVNFACLDVFETEPYCGPLCSLENVILTPHIGSYAREARALMERAAVENLIKGLHEVGML
ncbi:MAG: phosphoglycerate dehydrogenase [Syntrophobacterales bacterium]